MIGGTSSPVNVRCLLFDLPTSNPMKLPESSVPNPDTPLRVTRGSTTQNFASSTIRSPAFLSIFAVTSTFEWSEESCTAVTCPMFTSLYLMKVLPASTPWAALKTNGNGWALAQDALDRDADRHHRGENRDDPDHRDPLAPPWHDGGSRKIVWAFSHGALVCSFPNPRSAGDQRTLPRSLLARPLPRKTVLPDRALPTSAVRVARERR